MKLSNKVKFSLIVLLIILNIILRFQAVPQEIGVDSFLVHMMSNSISEFGYAKWILQASSFFGMYPYSEVSAVPFFISGIFQLTRIEMKWVIFLYDITLSALSIFTIYLIAGAINNDDVFKFIAAFAFSTSQAVVGYSTWTIAARGLFVILAPLLVYMLLKCRKDLKFIPLMILFALFLYATHHMIYFLIPSFFAFFILLILFRFNENLKTPAVLTPIIPAAGFFLMFSIPFFSGRFIENSKYDPIFESYVRYIGILIIPAVGGLIYLIFKRSKSFEEWFLLLSIVFLTGLIYEKTYMKWFLPIFAVPLMCIGLVNILQLEKRRYALVIVFIFLTLSVGFSGYYQFLHFLQTDRLNERYIEDSTYNVGNWIKEYGTGSAISNDILFGNRIASVSETVHFLVPDALLDFTYDFVKINLSDFEQISITSDRFWFNVGRRYIRDVGEDSWDGLNKHEAKIKNFNITYFVENTKAEGQVVWNHKGYPSKLLYQAYNESNLVYDSGKPNVWELNEV